MFFLGLCVASLVAVPQIFMQQLGADAAQPAPMQSTHQQQGWVRSSFQPAMMSISLLDEFVIIHNRTAIRDHASVKNLRFFSCRYFYPNGTFLATSVRHISRQNVHCAHPPEALRPAFIGQPVTVAAAPSSGLIIVTPTFVRYHYDALLPHPYPVVLSPTMTARDELTALPQVLQRKHNLCACLIMWNRTEFLYEWLLYYRHVHNLTKVFIYDNMSKEDYLRGHLTWLGLLFDIEYVDYPLYMAQFGFVPHCGIRAMSQCQWTTFYDVDEYYVHPRNTLPQRLAALPTKVGAMRAFMNFVRSHEVYPTLPGGGILRNFNCPLRKLNYKTVLRAGAAERNFYNFAHIIEVDSRHSTLQDYDGELMHYAYLSLDMFLLKLHRRVSYATEEFFMVGDYKTRLQREYYDYWKNFTCQPEPPTYATFKCHTSYKQVSTVAYRSKPYPPYQCLVANNEADARSLAVVGDRGGLKVVQLGPGSSVGKVWWIGHPQNGQPRFRRLVHVVEQPLDGIGLLMQEQEQRSAPADATLAKAPYSVRLLAAMLEWVSVHQMFELVADARVRAEDVRSCPELCSASDASACQTECSIVPLPTPQRDTKPSWAHTWAVNSHLSHVIVRMARNYGYTTVEPPEQRADEPPLLSADQWPGTRLRAAQTFVHKFSDCTVEVRMNSDDKDKVVRFFYCLLFCFPFLPLPALVFARY